MSDAPKNPYDFTREEYDQLVSESQRCQISERSKYEEVELVDDCTLFDIYRQPRAPVTDPQATKTLPVRVLNADLTCPICLGIMKDTMVVMECLHRFCGECISKSIFQSKRECPSCRIHIPSKRSLRRDENFDALIRKIHPNLVEFELNEDKLIEQLNKSRNYNNAYTESTRMGVLSQAASRRHGGRKKAAEGAASAPASASSSRAASPSETTNESPPVGEKRKSPERSPPSDNQSASASAAASEDEGTRKKLRVDSSGVTTPEESTPAATPSQSPAPSPVDGKVTLRVLLHQEEQADAPKLKRTLFTTSTKLKIRHLKRHLRNMLQLDSVSDLCIVLPKVNCKLSGLATSVSKGGIRKDLQCDQELDDYVTVEDIYQQYGMGTAWELRLLYHFSPETIVNGLAHFVSHTA